MTPDKSLHILPSFISPDENIFLRLIQLFSLTSEGVNYEEIDAKDPETLTEVEKIALLGRPRLGDVTKIQIRIKESKEFKVRKKRVNQTFAYNSVGKTLRFSSFLLYSERNFFVTKPHLHL